MSRALVLFVAASSLCAAVRAAPEVMLELRSDAKVGSETVTLGQLARLRSKDLDLLRQLVNLPMGRAPRPGQVAGIRREDVLAWIERHAGVQRERIGWVGAEQGRIQRPVVRVRGEGVATAALVAVRSWLAEAGLPGEVHVAVLPRDIEVPEAAVSFRVRHLPVLQLRRRMLVWVDIWAGEALVRSVPVSLEGPAGIPLQLAAAARELSPAAAPSAGDTEGPWSVSRGEWAVLRSMAGAVALESRVEVLQDGRRGDKVRVRQQGVAGSLLARVSGKGQLELAP